MTLSLRARFFITSAFVVAASLGLVILLAAHEERTRAIERSRVQLERDARHAVWHVVDLAPLGDWQVVAQRLGAVEGRRVTLIDSAGRVRGDSEVSAERLAQLENHADRPEVRAALAGRAGHDMRVSASIGAPLLYVAVPTGGVPGVAVLRLAQPLVDIDRASSSLVRMLIGVALVTLVLALGLLAWLTGRHASRVSALEGVTQRVGAGDPDARARELPADEVGRLGQSINRMAEELRARLEALELERDRGEQILARMSDGVALVGGDGRLIQANAGMAAILGASFPTSAETRSSFARWPELDDLLRTARAADRTLELDLRLWTTQQRLVRATATPLGRAHPGAVLLVLHDLSEVERLDRVRRDFVANVSHELKTPLTSVRGYAETLLEGGLEDVENRESFLRIIRDQAARLQVLVEDLLSLADLERPDARLKFERFDLREALERQLGIFRGRARQAGLRLELEPGPALPLTADRGRIEQVLANLLDNAVKYTERGGVMVRVGGDEHKVWCEVRDTGPGIPEADLGRIFERFYRVDKTRSREKGGTGLGLSIVKHIVALHDGEVTVESTAGSGSSFRFEIPRDRAGS